jgi:VanZ family protein
VEASFLSKTNCLVRAKPGSSTSSNPWLWIITVFAVQLIGSVVIVRLFELDFREVAIPVYIIAFGTVASLFFLWYDRSSEIGEWKWWVPALIYFLFIFALSNRDYSPGEVPFSAKVFHVVEYSMLGLLLCRAWYSTFRIHSPVPFIARVLAVGVLYAASDEIHQSFIPDRTPAVSDVLLDASALCLGVAIFFAVWYVRARLGRRQSRG